MNFFVISQQSSPHETLFMGWTLLANYKKNYVKIFQKIMFFYSLWVHIYDFEDFRKKIFFEMPQKIFKGPPLWF